MKYMYKYASNGSAVLKYTRSAKVSTDGESCTDYLRVVYSLERFHSGMNVFRG